MARIVVTPEAVAALDRLILTYSLPADTRARFRRSVELLETFPLLGRALEGGGYDHLRFLLGPWRWLVVVYEHDETRGVIGIVTVQDAGSSTAATNFRA